MVFSPVALKSIVPHTSIQRIWVALSGGLDSTVLLHALARLDLPLPIMALHVNHQISPYAGDWQQQCAAFCQDLGVTFHSETVQVKRAGRGLEDAAREARYAVFTRFLQAGDLLLTAHHADDQAETLLLRLLRGSGPRGLAAMSRRRGLGKGELFRPLLGFSRADLEAYAQAENLRWVNDESNMDERYDRNYLRQQVTPLLRARWPDFTSRWQQTAELCASSENLLAELAADDLARAEIKPERLGWSVSLVFLRGLSIARRQNVLRFWLRQQGFTVPEQSHLEQIESQLINGREDAEAQVRWGKLLLHCYRERIYLLPYQAVTALNNKSDQQSGVVLIKGESCQRVLSPISSVQLDYCARVPGPGYLRADLSALQIKWRAGGERCQPQGRWHSQTLKKLLQEYGLEPWWRELIPLLYCEDKLAAVGDLWVCEGFAAEQGQAGYRLQWQISSQVG